jgi:hypothetical protein
MSTLPGGQQPAAVLLRSLQVSLDSRGVAATSVAGRRPTTVTKHRLRLMNPVLRDEHRPRRVEAAA